MEKSPIFLGAVGNVDGQTGVSLALNKEHTRQRRALGSMFTNSALANLEDLAQVQVHKFISKLKVKAEEGQAVDVADWCKPAPKHPALHNYPQLLRQLTSPRHLHSL